MKLSVIAAILSIFQVAIAAAPAGSLIDSQESLTVLSSLIAQAPYETNKQTIQVAITGYSSTPDQTDDSPWTTASNTRVHDGVIATNILPFGTKVQIPALFGEKTFTVEDRMNRRYNDTNIIDIWFEDRSTALKFGKKTDITIVVFEA